MKTAPPPPSYEYPLSLDCELEDIRIAENLIIRRLDEAARKRLLGITGVELDAEGRLAKFSSTSAFDNLLSPDLETTMEFYASNFVLVTHDNTQAGHFNFALKLLKSSRSSLYIGYGPDGSVSFQSPPCYFGTKRLQLASSDVAELRALFTAVSHQSADAKLSLMRDIWMYAMSDSPRCESRFVEASTLLEMLLLPKQSTELGFRFALRLAKLAAKFGFGDPFHTFEQAKTLYKIRSKLVHGGTDARLAKHEGAAYEFARKLLVLYLANPSTFDEDALDRLCITA